MQIETIAAATAEPSRAAFTCDAGELARAVKFLAGKVIEKRNSRVILSHVLISADLAGHVALTATDGDCWARVTVAADVEAPGDFCTDGHALAAALAKMAKGGDVAGVHDLGGGRAELKAGRAGMKVKTLPADDFPLPTVEIEGERTLSRFAVPAARFLADLAALAPVMSKQETRYYLGGIAMQARDMAGRDCLAMVATDGHGMAIASRPLPAGAESLPDMILPRAAVAMALASEKVAGPIEAIAIEHDPARFSAGCLRLDLGAVTIWAKLIDGTYPDWSRAWAGLCAGNDAAPCLFPELLPGAPVAMLEKLAKPFKGGLSWEYRGDRYIGSVAGDPGLAFLAMAMAGEGCGRKGFAYGFTGHGEAKAYLMALAEARGLPLPGELQARADAVTEAFGEDSASWDMNAGRAYRTRPWGKVAFDGPEVVARAGKVLGLTIAGQVHVSEWTEKALDWQALVERETWHAPAVEPLEGSYSIVMPAEGPAQLACESEIIGPDGVAYPVAMSDSAIHLSREQVRALVGESCFETMAVTLADGSTAHILAWLWRDGATRFLTVRPDGRTFAGGVYVTREEIERGAVIEATAEPEAEAPRAPMPEIAATAGAEGEGGGREGQDMAEAPEALHGPEIAPATVKESLTTEPAASVSETNTPAITDLHAALAELLDKAKVIGDALATLSGETDAAVDDSERAASPVDDSEAESCDHQTPPIVAKRTPAHERAIRRAWAERAEARRQRAGGKAFREMLDITEEALRDAVAKHEQEGVALRAWGNNALREVNRQRGEIEALKAERDTALTCVHAAEARERALLAERDALKASRDEWEEFQHRTWSEAMGHKMARRRAVAMALAARQAARKARADLADMKRRLADPARPERESDLSRLVAERDAARASLASERERLATMQATLDRTADAVVEAATRAIRAETALKAVQARANGWLPAVRPVNVAVRFASAA